MSAKPETAAADERMELVVLERDELRVAIERRAAQNARLARAILVGTGPQPERLDLSELFSAAEKATGLTREQLLAAAGELVDPEPRSERLPDAHTVARRRMETAAPKVNGESCIERHIRAVADRDPVRCDALEAVAAFLVAPESVLVLSGGVGTQKTGSACWALSQAPGQFVDAGDLLAIGIEDKARYLKLRQAKLVVVDDLGYEIDDTGKWKRAFTSLLNGWYASCAKVIMTCNLRKDEFKTAYGERVVDRLRECGRWVTVGGESVRPSLRQKPTAGSE